MVGPVAFKDVHKEEDNRICPPEEYAGIISTLPSFKSSGLHVRLYQDVWLTDHVVPGIIALQRRHKPQPGDVVLASPPKSGTTWLKALSFAVMGRTAYPPSDADHPLRRLNPHRCVPFMDNLFAAGQESKLDALPSPRLLHTHAHHSMLPPSMADCKIVFVCREPKDMLVSMWHFLRSSGSNNDFPFSALFELACEGKNPYGPIWDQLLGYWSASRATPERVLFLKYEEMLVDPVSTVRELARFLGVPFTDAEEAAGWPLDIANMCSIDTLRGLEANMTGKSGLFFKWPHQSFFRKGVVGDWVGHIMPEMAHRIDAIIQEKLRGSGLTFTS